MTGDEQTYARGGLIPGGHGPGLTLVHPGEQYISREQLDAAVREGFAQMWTPTSPAAFHVDPVKREQQRAYLARVFGVPLSVVDPDRMRAEVRLRVTEVDRWADDGGAR